MTGGWVKCLKNKIQLYGLYLISLLWLEKYSKLIFYVYFNSDTDRISVYNVNEMLAIIKFKLNDHFLPVYGKKDISAKLWVAAF